jgi:hypothetical protein
MTGSEGARPSGTNRRTVVKGAAWAVPAVAVASAAPAMAASPCIPEITFSDDSCRCPGQSTEFEFTYFVRLCADDTTCPDSEDDFVTVTGIASKTGGPGGTPLTPVGFSFPIQVPVGECTQTVYELGSTNSSINLILTFADDSTQDITAPVQECADCDS